MRSRNEAAIPARRAEKGSRRLSPAGWALLAGSTLLVVYLVGLAFTAPNACGWFGDDAIYLATAKALAQGDGYRRIDLPGEPHQTKYPVLYPLLLSLVWRVAGDYPANLPWLRLPNALLAAAAVLLGVWYAARHLPLGRIGLIVLALLALTTPELRLYSYFTMSELLFAALATTALVLAERAVAATGRRAITPAIACGAIAGLAYLSRSIGLTLIIALAAWALCRRRFAVAASSTLLGALVLVGCWLWKHDVATTDGALRQAALLQYELDYSAWLPGSLPDAVRIAGQNFFRIAFANFLFIVRLPMGWHQSAHAAGGGPLVLAHLGVWVCLAVTLIGYLGSARTRVTAAHVFLPTYMGAVLVWPFEPIRFLAPIFVFVIGFQLLGWTYAARWIGRVPFVRNVPPRAVQVVAVLAGLCLTGSYVAQHRVILGFKGQTASVLAHRVDLEEHRRLTEQIRRHTPAEAVIASPSPTAVYLTTGRKAVDVLPNVDPAGYAYSPSRDWRTFYMDRGPGEAERMRADALEHLDRAYREVGVRYQVISARSSLAVQAALAAQRAAFPERYRLVYRPAEANVAVFEVLDAPPGKPTR